MLRLLTRVANPFTRSALIALAWRHRHSIRRWGRSLYTELRRPGRIEPRRLQQIGRVLWTITRDESLAGAKQLREVRLDGAVLVVDTAPGWKRSARLVDALSDVPGITGITDAKKGNSLVGSIPTSARSG